MYQEIPPATLSLPCVYWLDIIRQKLKSSLRYCAAVSSEVVIVSWMSREPRGKSLGNLWNSKSDERTANGNCCGTKKAFTRSSSLETNERFTEKKLFPCSVCGEKFSHQSDLSFHKRVHSGERLYKCDVCNRTFSRSYNLATHKKVHTRKGLLKCEECGRTFLRSNHLTNHKKSHGLFLRCTICDKWFSESHELTVHQRIHTGFRPYKCNICKEAFITLAVLLSHQQSHAMSRHYKCNICDQTFEKLADLLFHQRHHVGEQDLSEEFKSNQAEEGDVLSDEHENRNVKLHHNMEPTEEKLLKVNSPNHICQEYHEEFSSTQEFVDHKSVSHGHVEYECHHCQAKLHSRKTFEQHQFDHELEATEPMGMEYICFRCDVSFNLARKLVNHMVEVHQNGSS